MVKYETLLIVDRGTYMPFNKDKLAYASNDAGKGPIHCLAHVLVAHINKGPDSRLRVLAVERLFHAYKADCLKKGQPALGEKEFFEKIKVMTPLGVEKEITPILEGLFGKEHSKPYLNRLVDLGNFFGLSVEVHVAKRDPESEINTARFYHSNLLPSKRVSQTGLPKLQETVGKGTIDIVSKLEIMETWDEDYESVPTMKLFLEDNQTDGLVGFNCHYEYPIWGKNDGEKIRLHNADMVKENERVKEALPKTAAEPEESRSFLDNLSGLVTMLGAFLAKVVDVFFRVYQEYETRFGGKAASASSSSASATALKEKELSFEKAKKLKPSDFDRPGSVVADPLLPPSPAVLFSGGPGSKRSVVSPSLSQKRRRHSFSGK